MDYLREYAEEHGLRKVVDAAIEHSSVQGAVLKLDELWLSAWRCKESGRLDDWERQFRMLRHWGPWPVPYFLHSLHQVPTGPWTPSGTPDLNWRPPDWEMYCDMMGFPNAQSPIRLVIALRPPESGQRLYGLELPSVPLTVSREVRPIARLASDHRVAQRPVKGGSSIGTGFSTFGTLGGLVRDAGGQLYGSTCAHVFPSPAPVDQPARSDDATARQIGLSTAEIKLLPCPRSGPCNPYLSSPHISDVDSTLVELESGVSGDLDVLSIGKIAGHVGKNSLTPGQAAAFAGRTSGNRQVEIGGLAVFYRMQLESDYYCFRDLMEIRRTGYFASHFSSVVQPGDSGSWVCAETDRGPAWCGQVIGEDRQIGYAAFAENIVAAWSSRGKFLVAG